jgi:hypothetical protein
MKPSAQEKGIMATPNHLVLGNARAIDSVAVSILELRNLIGQDFFKDEANTKGQQTANELMPISEIAQIIQEFRIVENIHTGAATMPKDCRSK